MDIFPWFAVKIEDKHFKIQYCVIENISVNYASRVAIEGCRLHKKMQHIQEFYKSFD